MEGDIFFQEQPVEILINDDGTHSVSFATMAIEVAEMDRRPFCSPTVYPPGYYAPIGAIIVQWGAVEALVDQIAEAFSVARGGLAKDAPRGFRKRVRFLKSVIRQEFLYAKNVHEALDAALGRATNLHVRRNLLAHGNIQFNIEIYKAGDEPLEKKHVRIEAIAHGENDGRKLQHKFKIDDFKKTFYDLADVAGRLRRLFLSPSNYPGLRMHEKVALVEFRDKYLKEERREPLS